MTGSFHIHGLSFQLVSDHPVLFQHFSEDLRYFQTRKTRLSGRTIRLRLSALPRLSETNGYPPDFIPHREMEAQHRILPDQTTVLRFAYSLVTVLTDSRKKRIRAAVVPEAQLLPDPAYHLCFTQPVSFWLKRRSLFFLHAGCVAEGPSGVLIIGHSRAGKSSLSASAVQQGFHFLSDEQPVLCERAGSIAALAFPRRIRLDQASAANFPELEKLARESKPERILIPVNQWRPESIQESCIPRLLVFPKFKTRGTLSIRRLHPSQALARLLEDDHFIWYRNKSLNGLSRKHLNLFEKLVRQAPAVELEYTDPKIPEIPSLFRKLLKKNSP